jgi:hypothetical protein
MDVGALVGNLREDKAPANHREQERDGDGQSGSFSQVFHGTSLLGMSSRGISNPALAELTGITLPEIFAAKPLGRATTKAEIASSNTGSRSG